MADEPVTRPDLPMPKEEYALVRRVADLLAEATDTDLPPETWELAKFVYVNWHVGDPGEDRFRAALLVAARLIRQDERERAEAKLTRIRSLCGEGVPSVGVDRIEAILADEGSADNGN